jgi:hypothetical protein
LLDFQRRIPTVRISKLPTSALTASIALTALAGCAGNSQMAPLAQTGVGSTSIQGPAFQNGRLNSFLAMHGDILPGHGVTRPSFMDRRALRKPLVFLSDGGANVDIFLQGGKNKMVGQVSGFQSAEELATDTPGDLYVVDYFADTTVYAPPYTNGPKLTLHPGRYPGDIAVSRQGTVAVITCTILSGSQCGQGVLFYAAGSTTPCATVLTQDQKAFANGVGNAGFDGKGNLYIDGLNSVNTTSIGRIDGGCNAKRVRTLTINNTIQHAGSIEVNKAGQIAILDSSNSNDAVIDTYNPPKGGSLGSPVLTTSLTVPNYAGPFTFQASGRGLWLLYQTSMSSSETASEYAYPAGGAPKKSIISTPSQSYFSVAVTPVLVP